MSEEKKEASQFEGNKVEFICKSCGAVHTRDGKVSYRRLGRKPIKPTKDAKENENENQQEDEEDYF